MFLNKLCDKYRSVSNGACFFAGGLVVESLPRLAKVQRLLVGLEIQTKCADTLFPSVWMSMCP